MSQYERRIHCLEAFLIDVPPREIFLGRGEKTGAQLAGLRYERKVLNDLCSRFSHNFLPSPWFTYVDSGNRYRRFCQCDGILFDIPNGIATLVEIKIRHTETAFRQLENLYLPVLQSMLGFELWKYALCEVTKWFDCTERMSRVRIRQSIDQAIPGEHSIVILRP